MSFKEIWDFIQEQILGMKWLNQWIGNLLSGMGIDLNSRWGGSIQFFIYDVIKITFLLCLLIFFILVLCQDLVQVKMRFSSS